jgi:hypothetical protein
MAIMDDGRGSSGSRAAVFFLSLGFGLSVRVYPIGVKRCADVVTHVQSMFENVVGNGVAGNLSRVHLFEISPS